MVHDARGSRAVGRRQAYAKASFAMSDRTSPPSSRITMFVENEAGSSIKHHYNEQALTLLHTEEMQAPYPFPYGFVPGTLAPDGDCVDVFLITDREYGTGDTVECIAVALLEQTEGGVIDHNLMAVPIGEPVPDLDLAVARVEEFLERFLEDVPGQKVMVGRLQPVEAAVAYLDRHTHQSRPGR